MGLNVRLMVRSVKLLAPLVTVLVVAGCAEIHAALHRPLLTAPRRSSPAVARRARCRALDHNLRRRRDRDRNRPGGASAPFDGGSVQRHRRGVRDPAHKRRALLPDFDLGMSVVFLIPLLTIIAGMGERSRAHQGTQERVVAVVGEEDAERLRREVTGQPEQPSVLVAMIVPKEALPSEHDEAPLETLVKSARATCSSSGEMRRRARRSSRRPSTSTPGASGSARCRSSTTSGSASCRSPSSNGSPSSSTSTRSTGWPMPG